MGNLTEKQAQRAFGRKIKKNKTRRFVKYQNMGGKSEKKQAQNEQIYTVCNKETSAASFIISKYHGRVANLAFFKPDFENQFFLTCLAFLKIQKSRQNLAFF